MLQPFNTDVYITKNFISSTLLKMLAASLAFILPEYNSSIGYIAKNYDIPYDMTISHLHKYCMLKVY